MPPLPPVSQTTEAPEIIFSAATVETAVGRLATAIGRAHAGHELVLVTVLNGAMVFAADLLRRLPLQVRLETVQARSYKGQNSGDLRRGGLPIDVAGRRLLLVDDILDSGRTLLRIREDLLRCHPERLETCVLLDKPEGRQVPIHADWWGLRAPDRFLVGYGLDLDGRHRNLPYIAAVQPHHPRP